MNALVLVGAAFALLSVASKSAASDRQKDEFNGKLGNAGAPPPPAEGAPRYSTSQKEKAAAFATRLYSAFHPYGFDAWQDGTDEDEVSAVAAEMKLNKIGLDLVSHYYAAAYAGADLLHDLQDELNADEWREFINTIS
jgi:hypothetical protein